MISVLFECIDCKSINLFVSDVCACVYVHVCMYLCVRVCHTPCLVARDATTAMFVSSTETRPVLAGTHQRVFFADAGSDGAFRVSICISHPYKYHIGIHNIILSSHIFYCRCQHGFLHIIQQPIGCRWFSMLMTILFLS